MITIKELNKMKSTKSLLAIIRELGDGSLIRKQHLGLKIEEGLLES